MDDRRFAVSAARSLEALDRRGYPRFDAWKNGFVEVKSRTRIACLIENVSENGALLRFASAIALPKRFLLLVPEDDLTICCEHIRLDGNAVGVRFIALQAAETEGEQEASNPHAVRKLR
jgi:hypothetical protein